MKGRFAHSLSCMPSNILKILNFFSSIIEYVFPLRGGKCKYKQREEALLAPSLATEIRSASLTSRDYVSMLLFIPLKVKNKSRLV